MNKSVYLLPLVLFLLGNRLFAQELSVPAWGGGADQKDLSFGFSFSSVNSYYKIDKTPNWRNPFLDPNNNNQPVTGNVNSISSNYSPGFGVGFLTRYRITENLEARVTPSLIFIDKMLYYTYDTTPSIAKTVSTTTVDVPLLLKLKSDRVGDFRAYILGGIKYSQAIGSKVNTDADAAPLDKLVKNINSYGSYEAGLGCDIYFEFFKLSPEIKLSNSFGDVLYHENNAFSSPISRLTLHTLMFSLYFE
jgi:Outer membrane protein beta-barrel domain